MVRISILTSMLQHLLGNLVSFWSFAVLKVLYFATQLLTLIFSPILTASSSVDDMVTKSYGVTGSGSPYWTYWCLFLRSNLPYISLILPLLWILHCVKALIWYNDLVTFLAAASWACASFYFFQPFVTSLPLCFTHLSSIQSVPWPVLPLLTSLPGLDVLWWSSSHQRSFMYCLKISVLSTPLTNVRSSCSTIPLNWLQ